jgi:hypothetical protein
VGDEAKVTMLKVIAIIVMIIIFRKKMSGWWKMDGWWKMGGCCPIPTLTQ